MRKLRPPTIKMKKKTIPELDELIKTLTTRTKTDNELIAEFDGLSYEAESRKWCYRDSKIPAIVIWAREDSDLEYANSWDWLMPVVEKITLISTGDDDFFYPRTFGMRDAEGNYMFRFNRMPLYTAKSFIEATHAAVVDFIVTRLI